VWLAGPAAAQDFPARPITIVVGVAPGGITDVSTRIYADAVSKSLNQKIVVENRPVGGGTVAAVAVQNAAPDGYTLLTITGSAHAAIPAMQPVAYHPVQGFTPITLLFRMPVLLVVPTDERGRLTGVQLEQTLAPADLTGAFAIVATAGTTNAGIVDDLAGIADVAAAHRLWLHVDGAYGLAALAAKSARSLFRGIERADSFSVDPHKWLFAPFDCAALLYRDPAQARRAHTQHAAYLEVLQSGPDWNPSDFAFHLTRRARGLPFWFSLATHGTDAYGDAIETTLELTRTAARLINAHPLVELLAEPELSVVLFRRVGWAPADYAAWSDRVLLEGLTLTVPTTWRGETCLRFCFVNPRTTIDDVALILATLS
jgi:glutamate/tyrosine decarboxylase-like PLP-dependent enzyme